MEYSEVTNDSAERRNPDGSLTFSAANICIHFFTREFLERIVNIHDRNLVHHVAKKKIPFIDTTTGNTKSVYIFELFPFYKVL